MRLIDNVKSEEYDERRREHQYEQSRRRVNCVYTSHIANAIGDLSMASAEMYFTLHIDFRIKSTSTLSSANLRTNRRSMDAATVTAKIS